MRPPPHFILSLAACWCAVTAVAAAGDRVYQFPKEFLFGTATAAYQVEGAWNKGDKTESMWDRMVHSNASAIVDGSNGDVACDSLRLWRRDVEMVRELGVHMYRLSLSWPRLVPDPFLSRADPEAVAHYGRLIDALLAAGVQPAVTLYHWDLPQRLQDLGGWTNPLVVDHFVDYAELVFRLFGDRVKIWITINEPKQICLYGYGRSDHAPQLNMPGVADYLCAKNVLLAHARVWRLYHERFRSEQRGVCGITAHVQWYEPATDTVADADAARDATAFEQDLYMYPIFGDTGDFPDLVKYKVATKSFQQGYPRSRLPELSAAEAALVRGSSDFFGANSYTSYLVRRAAPGHFAAPSHDDDMGAELIAWPSDRQPDDYWAYLQMFLRIRDEYGNPPVYVMENGLGAPVETDSLRDEARARHYQRAVRVVHDALDLGCDVRAFTAWSLMDNFEWANGYTVRFGLYHVDFSDPNRTRTPKTSALVYRHIATNRQLDEDYWPL